MNQESQNVTYPFIVIYVILQSYLLIYYSFMEIYFIMLNSSQTLAEFIISF